MEGVNTKVLTQFRKILLATGITSMTLATSASATVIYDISWQGAESYAMNGYFEFNELAADDGLVTARELTSFYIDVTQGGVSLGTWDFIKDGLNRTAFNFNFNTVTETFQVGGGLFEATGQYWNMASTSCNGAGFQSAVTTQLVCADGVWRPESLTYVSDNLLLAKKRDLVVVPEPGTAVLMLLGLFGLLASRRTKQGKH